MHKLLSITFAVAAILVVALFVHQRIQYDTWYNNREVIEYRVKWGDTLNDIGYEYKPSWMDVREYCYYIADLNSMDDSNIYEGQTIKLYAIGE